MLRVLIEHRGDVIEKSDLLHFVWPNTFVEENNLARHISTLRKVLQERRGHHDIISTIPGHGYMFTASVVELAAEPPPETPIAAAADDTANAHTGDSHIVDTAQVRPEPASTAGHPRPWWHDAAAVLIVVAVGAAVLLTVTGGCEHLVSSSDNWMPTSPRWSRDGTQLAYLRRLSDRPEVATAVAIHTAGGAARLLRPGQGRDRDFGEPAVSADHRDVRRDLDARRPRALSRRLTG